MVASVEAPPAPGPAPEAVQGTNGAANGAATGEVNGSAGAAGDAPIKSENGDAPIKSEKADLEAGGQEKGAAPEPAPATGYGGEPLGEISAPDLSYIQIFLKFLTFGFLAFGGPGERPLPSVARPTALLACCPGLALARRPPFPVLSRAAQQIAMMKEQLVEKEKWVTSKRFVRVFGACPAVVFSACQAGW